MSKPVNCGCGGKPVVGHLETSDRWYIGCPDCDICTRLYNTEIEVVKAWNLAMGKQPVKVERVTANNGRTWEQCSRCLNEVYYKLPYCPSCGARLEWK